MLVQILFLYLQRYFYLLTNLFVMAKTLEEVLAVSGLTAAQKERAKEWVKAQERFGKPTTFEVDTDQQVKDRLNNLQQQYDKRKAREEKAKATKKAEKAENEAIYAVIKEAKALDYTVDDIVAFVRSGIKEKKNAKLREQIAALQAQLEE